MRHKYHQSKSVIQYRFNFLNYNKTIEIIEQYLSYKKINYVKSTCRFNNNLFIKIKLINWLIFKLYLL